MTAKSQGRQVYREVIGQLRVIELRYATDLNTEGRRKVRVVEGRNY
jgi:hypothetical protein